MAENFIDRHILAYKEIWAITFAWGLVRMPVWAALDRMPQREISDIIALALTTASLCILAYIGWKAKRHLGQSLKNAAIAAAILGAAMAFVFIPLGILLEPYFHFSQGDISKVSGVALLITIPIAAAITAIFYVIVAAIGYLIAGIRRTGQTTPSSTSPRLAPRK